MHVVGAGDKRVGALLIAAVAVLNVPQGAAQMAQTGHAHGGATSCTANLGNNAASLVAEDDHAVTTLVTTMADGGVAGYTTYQVSLLLAAEVQNVYTIYGDARPLEFPPAYQVATAFGTNLCGANPQFFSFQPTAQYDSWLTVGLTAGNTNNAISSIGISFEGWSEHNALVSAADTGGSVFWMNPDDATASVTYNGGQRSVVIAQVTLRSTAPSADCRFDAQGRSMGHTAGTSTIADWEENCIEVKVGGLENGYGTHSSTHLTAQPPPPPPVYRPPPPPASGPTTTGCPLTMDGFFASGHWAISGTTALDQRATAICNPGYTCTDCVLRDCRYEAAKGTYRWAPGQGRCTAPANTGYATPTCAGPLPVIAGGTLVVAPGSLYPYAVNTRATLTCQHGYYPTGSGFASCTGSVDSGYMWHDESAGSCQVACAATVPPLTGGEWTRGGSGAVVTASLTCDFGYHPTSRGASIECTNAGSRWTTSPATCTKDVAAGGGEQVASAEDPGSHTGLWVVLLLLAAGGGYYAKENQLGPFAADGKDLMGGAGPAGTGGESTIYDTGGDDTL